MTDKEMNLMKISREEAVCRYNMIRDEVRSRCPEQWEIVVALCKAVPAQIDANSVWRFGRNKPCYSNIKVKIGERVAQDIGLSQDFEDWKRIASDDWAITLKERGPRWKRNSNFTIEGHAAKNFVSMLQRGGLRSYLWRLYCIRELALALQHESVEPCIKNLIECNDVHGGLPFDKIEQWTRQFSRLAGLGWGHTTAYHMLTDLGASVKPDIWLTTSVIRMGLLAPTQPSDLPEGELRDIIRDPNVQHLTAKRAMELSTWISPTACPDNPRSAMREVDKVLMEWSRQRLARPLKSRPNRCPGTDHPTFFSY